MILRARLAERPGLSRADITVALAIGGLSLCLLVIWRAQTERGSKRYYTQNHLKQIALACHSYYDVHKKLPPAFDQVGALTASVHVHLLPFVAQEGLHNAFLAGKGEPDALVRVFVSEHDPSIAEEVGIQNFAANLRVFSNKGRSTLFDQNMAPLAEREPGAGSLVVKDGTSYTVLFSTKYGRCGEGGSRFTAAPNSPFAAFFGQNAARVIAHPSDETATFQRVPSEGECRTRPLMAQSYFQSGVLVAMADGTVRYVDSAVSPWTWNSVLQPNNGNDVGDRWERLGRDW